MRNPSKNTLKQLARPGNGMPAGWAYRHTRYWFFNEVGARAYGVSKGKIEHRAWDGFFLTYLSAAQRRVHEQRRRGQ